MIISQSSSIMDGMGSESRSLVQILVKSCLHCRAHIFGPIFFKNALNVCLDDISVKCDHGWDWVKKKVTRSNLSKILRLKTRANQSDCLMPDFFINSLIKAKFSLTDMDI